MTTATFSIMRLISSMPSVRTVRNMSTTMPAPLNITTTFARPDSAPMMLAAIHSPSRLRMKRERKTRRPFPALVFCRERVMFAR